MVALWMSDDWLSIVYRVPSEYLQCLTAAIQLPNLQKVANKTPDRQHRQTKN